MTQVRRQVVGLSVAVALGVACSDGSGGEGGGGGGGGNTETVDAGPPDAGYNPGWQLGRGDHTAASVTFTVIASESDGLNMPRDLEFHNSRPDELWVVNRRDDSTVTVYGATTADRSAVKKIDGFALHFMEEVSSVAFGKPDQFATCHESRNTYNGQAPGNDFMGPALWSSDPTIYAVVDPIGLGSHLDMLHQTPLCMGIAHIGENQFWVFDGLLGALTYYDFVEDHGPGYDDHSDGIIYRYAEGQVSRVENVPSHLAVDNATGIVYVADTGNGRVGKMDPAAATRGRRLPAVEVGTQHYLYNNAAVEDVVPPGTLTRPSGLELHEGLLWVTDNATSKIHVFQMDGTQVNWLETGLPAGTLMGITFGPDNLLYLVDAMGNQVLRVEP